MSDQFYIRSQFKLDNAKVNNALAMSSVICIRAWNFFVTFYYFIGIKGPIAPFCLTHIPRTSVMN